MKCLYVVAQKGYREEELEQPKAILEKGKIKCDVTSIAKGLAFGMQKGETEIKKSVRDIDLDEYEAIVFVGGKGAPDLLNHQEVLNLAVNAYERRKLIGAICIAPVILAEAGVLYKKNATVFENDFSMRYFLSNKVNYVKLDVVKDGNIITADGPQSATKFGTVLLKELKERK